jgi:hypothetical protein
MRALDYFRHFASRRLYLIRSIISDTFARIDVATATHTSRLRFISIECYCASLPRYRNLRNDANRGFKRPAFRYAPPAPLIQHSTVLICHAVRTVFRYRHRRRHNAYLPPHRQSATSHCYRSVVITTGTSINALTRQPPNHARQPELYLICIPTVSIMP